VYGDADNEGFKKQFPKNLFANIANFIVSIAIGIFLVPYFIDTLGIAAYGLIPLATSFTSYVTILTDSLNTAVSRYLIFDLHQKDYKKANRTFNTALIGLSGLVLVLIPCVVVLSYYAPKFFNVPAGQESGVILLFLGVLAAFLIRSWSSNFTVSLFAYNRLDLLNLLYVISIIVQVFLIVTLFTVFSPQLGYIGLAYLVSSIIFLIGAFILSKRLNPHLHIDVREFDRSRLDELSFITRWAVIDQIGSLLLFQFDLIVVNLLFGATMAGEYAVVFLWVVLLRGIGGTLSGVLSPMILTYFAQGKVDQIIQVAKSAVKGFGLLIALPIGLICGFSSQILALWVGPQYISLSLLMWVLTLPLAISLCILPLFAINVAYNKVRIPGIVTLVFGIGYVFLAFYLPPLLGWGYYGVAIAGVIILTLRSGFFVPWYATKIMGIPSHSFTRSLITGVFASLIVAGVTVVVGKLFLVSSLLSLVIFSGIISLMYLMVIWLTALSPFERELVISYIPKKMRSA
jgi:membrane protein EpsK